MNRVFLYAAALIGMIMAPVEPAAQAQTAAKEAYSAVDEVSVAVDSITITGVVLGQSAPTTRTYRASDYNGAGTAGALQNCVRLAMMAMAKPGAYLFAVAYSDSFSRYPACRLSRTTQ